MPAGSRVVSVLAQTVKIRLHILLALPCAAQCECPIELETGATHHSDRAGRSLDPARVSACKGAKRGIRTGAEFENPPEMDGGRPKDMLRGTMKTMSKVQKTTSTTPSTTSPPDDGPGGPDTSCHVRVLTESGFCGQSGWPNLSSHQLHTSHRSHKNREHNLHSFFGS